MQEDVSLLEAVIAGIILFCYTFALLFTLYRFTLTVRGLIRWLQKNLITTAHEDNHKPENRLEQDSDHKFRKEIIKDTTWLVLGAVTIIFVWFGCFPHFTVHPPKVVHPDTPFANPFLLKNRSFFVPKEGSLELITIKYKAAGTTIVGATTYITGPVFTRNSPSFGKHVKIPIGPMAVQDFSKYPVDEMLIRLVLRYTYFSKEKVETFCFRLLTDESEYGWVPSDECDGNVQNQSLETGKKGVELTPEQTEIHQEGLGNQEKVVSLLLPGDEDVYERGNTYTISWVVKEGVNASSASLHCYSGPGEPSYMGAIDYQLPADSTDPNNPNMFSWVIPENTHGPKSCPSGVQSIYIEVILWDSSGTSIGHDIQGPLTILFADDHQNINVVTQNQYWGNCSTTKPVSILNKLGTVIRLASVEEDQWSQTLIAPYQDYKISGYCVTIPTNWKASLRGVESLNLMFDKDQLPERIQQFSIQAVHSELSLEDSYMESYNYEGSSSSLIDPSETITLKRVEQVGDRRVLFVSSTNSEYLFLRYFIKYENTLYMVKVVIDEKKSSDNDYEAFLVLLGNIIESIKFIPENS